MQEQQYQHHHIPLMQIKNMWRVQEEKMIGHLKLGLSKLFKIDAASTQLTKEFLSTVALAFPNHNGDQPAGDGLLLLQDRRCQWAHLHLSSMPTLWTSQ
ncbi:unnamed protein product [Microthlaspi erraticum]|uniref:Uncharacterized protein n=1 Tax=Microthlaspi erraticum TaxID=1685480 RepID=A0A6D2HXT7_9BRAS|nr:unnamed protein product [Microthlaspi erraticum]